jgi:hypothetical protein
MLADRPERANISTMSPRQANAVITFRFWTRQCCPPKVCVLIRRYRRTHMVGPSNRDDGGFLGESRTPTSLSQ